MQTLLATAYPQGDAFSATQWSVIVAAGESVGDAENSRAALTSLCQTYWPPLYTYARSRGHSVHDAQDQTQVFFRLHART